MTDPDRGKMRKAADDGVQAAIWVFSLVLLATLLAVGIGWGVQQRFSIERPGGGPDLPTLPGKTPEPKSP